MPPFVNELGLPVEPQIVPNEIIGQSEYFANEKVEFLVFLEFDENFIEEGELNFEFRRFEIFKEHIIRGVRFQIIGEITLDVSDLEIVCQVISKSTPIPHDTATGILGYLGAQAAGILG